MNYSKIRKQISEGDLSKAIVNLNSDINKLDHKERDELLIQSSRLSNILKEKRIGTVSEEKVNLTVNQVTKGVLDLIDQLEQKGRIIPNKTKSHEPKKITFEISNGDVLKHPSDVLVLKYAQDFHGVDRVVSKILTKSKNISYSVLKPKIGKTSVIDSEGAIESGKVLFMGVKKLWEFRYAEISQFMEESLLSISTELKLVKTVTYTIHGVGYGLDEIEAFQSQLIGLKNVIIEGKFSENLKKITIVEKDTERFYRLLKYMDKFSGLLGFKKMNDTQWMYSYRSSDIMNALSKKQKLHTIEEKEIVKNDKPFVFVAMPFKKEFDDIFYFGIQGAVHENGMLCERIDQESFTGDILSRILSRIEQAKFVIAELSGSNPNVYLEVGYAWGKGKPTILLTKDANDLQFDLRGQRCLEYGRIIDLKNDLNKQLKQFKD